MNKTKACNKPIAGFVFILIDKNYFLNKLQFFSYYADKPYQTKKLKFFFPLKQLPQSRSAVADKAYRHHCILLLINTLQ